MKRLYRGELDRPLSLAERNALERDVFALLAWQTKLAAWKSPRSRVDAVPYVALYSKGRLHGCFGAEEGRPGERLARAFLSALEDKRFGLIPSQARAALSAEVSFVTRATPVDPDALEASFEPGIHGLGVSRGEGAAVILLPSVARDNGLKAGAMLDTLVRKARIASPRAERFFTFHTENVSARLGGGRARQEDAGQAAARWIAGLVQDDGSVLFGREARSGAACSPGEMHHARVAAAVQALDAHGGYERKVAHSRRRLAQDAAAALSGSFVQAWPDDPARVAGTLAHLVRAGVDGVRAALRGFASSSELAGAPWYAGQVATALGADTPRILRDACIGHLADHPWAPWTVLAHARLSLSGDLLSRAVEALVRSVREEGPHRGGVAMAGIPEIALTALTVEALRGVRATGPVRAAIRRGKAFLRAWQIDGERAPAAFDLEASHGALMASPISSVLRADVTGHALLALG
jgi:AMMECR1 domain-containing protein